MSSWWKPLTVLDPKAKAANPTGLIHPSVKQNATNSLTRPLGISPVLRGRPHDMSEELEKHVLRKYDILQKLGKGVR